MNMTIFERVLHDYEKEHQLPEVSGELCLGEWVLNSKKQWIAYNRYATEEDLVEWLSKQESDMRLNVEYEKAELSDSEGEF